MLVTSSNYHLNFIKLPSRLMSMSVSKHLIDTFTIFVLASWLIWTCESTVKACYDQSFKYLKFLSVKPFPVLSNELLDNLRNASLNFVFQLNNSIKVLEFVRLPGHIPLSFKINDIYWVIDFVLLQMNLTVSFISFIVTIDVFQIFNLEKSLWLT